MYDSQKKRNGISFTIAAWRLFLFEDKKKSSPPLLPPPFFPFSFFLFLIRMGEPSSTVAKVGGVESDGSSSPPVIEPYCIFTKTKVFTILFIISISGMMSPLSANIYFPALNNIQKVNLQPKRGGGISVGVGIVTYIVFLPFFPLLSFLSHEIHAFF